MSENKIGGAREGELSTVQAMLRWLAGYLRKKNLADPELEAQTLLGIALHKERMALLLEFERLITKPEQQALKAILLKRLAGEPIAYIQSQSYFWAFFLKVTEAVLIPRKETELLVETAWQDCQKNTDVLEILDLGTGSGAIALALAWELGKTEHVCSITASDNSKAALSVAEENYKTVVLSQANPGQKLAPVRFTYSDLFQSLPVGIKYNYIVSNPPYIRESEYAGLSVEVKKEPQSALLGGSDGLKFYRSILQKAPQYLAKDGCLALEHGYDQAKAIQALAQESGVFSLVRNLKDYSGQDRVLVFQYRA